VGFQVMLAHNNRIQRRAQARWTSKPLRGFSAADAHRYVL